MAASDPTSRESASADDLPETGVGLAHPTVVPANFDPAEDGIDGAREE